MVYYNCKFASILSKNNISLKELDQYININLCSYLVNVNGKYPFLQYMLINNGDNTLTIPKIPIYMSLNNNNLLPYSIVYLSELLCTNDFKEFNNDILFNGYYEYNDELYLFFNITNCKINIDETYLINNVRFGIIDEIINQKNICNIKINNLTSFFFIKNDLITYLYDEDDNIYEIPIVGFVGKDTEQNINFTMTFGESPKDKLAILGPYYYFTNFFNAIRKCGWLSNHDKSGLIRFALFIGKTKYIENAPNDIIDNSIIKKQMLEDENLNKQLEIQTLRISDHDGTWSTHYDSAYLGKIELDDGTFLNDTPLIVLKNYEQQIPLSCHYIDEFTLGEKYEENNYEYSIL